MAACVPAMCGRAGGAALGVALPCRVTRSSLLLEEPCKALDEPWSDAAEEETRCSSRFCTTDDLRGSSLRSCLSSCNDSDAGEDAGCFAAMLRESSRRMVSDTDLLDQQLPHRYGENACLPCFVPGRDVPVLGLLNPRSGSGAGADILEAARRTPYYNVRFFNVLDVVKSRERGGLLDLFRKELCEARLEAAALGTRPRLISAGGDGTASFALYVVLAALRADASRAGDGLEDRGSGFVWTDAELEESFPALAHMPLGSANDFSHTLGWGRKFPGAGEGLPASALRQLHQWIQAAVNPASFVASFDIWGILPKDGSVTCSFKLAELAGRRGADPKEVIHGRAQLVMKEAKTPVPFFVCLYFSAGFGAYMTSRFQLNRRHTAFKNKLQYCRQALGIAAEALPPQLQVGLEGVEIDCDDEHYFPPRVDEGNSGTHYREVGFLNVNWQASLAHGADRASLRDRLGALGASDEVRQPAKFNDGRMDMYRLKFRSVLKSLGPRYQTDKKKQMKLTYKGSKGQGLFIQWDGEARFAFSPTGEPFDINIRKVLNIPVVIGPQHDTKRTGSLLGAKEGMFRFEGETPEQRSLSRQRTLQLVAGQLDGQLNATREELRAAGLHVEGEPPAP